jgi:rfaE bifunctional protein kinase chain/domain
MLKEALAREISLIRGEASGKRVVFVSGNFNIIHPGHLRLLNFARSCGDCLVVGLFDDGEPGAVLPLDVRKEGLESLGSVTTVVSLKNSELVPLIAALQPYAVVKGKEHEGYDNPERVVVRSYGGHLIFSAGDARFSAVDLLRRELAMPSAAIVHHAAEFLTQHGSSLERLREVVSRFSGLRVAVLGELIIDEYITCDPLGMSQEDPTIVVTPVGSTVFTGGAGIVAAHMAGLGATASFISITGDDETAARSAVRLAELGVAASLIRDASRPTILKQRYRASNKTLLRVNHLRSHDAGEEFFPVVLDQLDKLLPTLDVLVFSDFNYGCLPNALITEICRRCRASGVAYVADSQASSQVGDVSRFVGTALLSATEREVRLAVNDFKSGLQNVANRLFEKSKAQLLIVKLAAEGIVILTREQGFSTATLPAMNRNPSDVAGAGDALLAGTTLALASGASVWEAAYLGSVSAALQVSRIGNVPLEQQTLLEELYPRG